VRNAFIKALTAVAERDRRVCLITGDLGFGVLNDFRDRLSTQFFNAGVAEQNMTSVAAGLALTGHVVFTYSIGNFPTLRCLEQIRLDVCYHRADVKIVTVGGGFAYGALGVTHFATEDLAILRAIPNLTLVAPGDPIEVEQLVPQIVETPGPFYLRLGRAGEAPAHRGPVTVRLGQPTLARPGRDVVIFTTGGMLPVGLGAADQLATLGIEAEVVSVHTVKPLDCGAVCGIAARFPAVVTCEEHSTLGGLGGAVAEALLEGGVPVRFRRFGIPGRFPSGVGSQEFLRTVNRLDAPALCNTVQALLDGRAAST
jgi:transketolase